MGWMSRVRQSENWLNSQAQWVGSVAKGSQVNNQESILGPLLFNIFIHNWHHEAVYPILGKFPSTWMLTRWRNRHTGTWWSLARRSCKSYTWGWNKPKVQYILWAHWLKSSITEKDWRFLMDTNFNMSQHHALVTKRFDDILGCSKPLMISWVLLKLQRSTANRSRDANRREKQIKSQQYKHLSLQSSQKELRLANHVLSFCKSRSGGAFVNLMVYIKARISNPSGFDMSSCDVNTPKGSKSLLWDTNIWQNASRMWQQ